MSEEKVEIIRDAVDGLSRWDIDAALANAAPDFELDFSRAVGPQHGVFGLDQMQAFMDEFAEPWESQRIEIEEFIEAGEDVVTFITNTLRSRGGIEVQARVAWVWTFSDGSVTRVTYYQERRQALEAAGLSE